ncbi:MULTISPECIES: DUF1778 domain-containing protein [Rhodospirillales]|uniref:DUF1778 domain-containing protein n=2 Tax=Rhodospirillales TaxID=204441 RepID=B6IVN2_RHOCS|nr:DUF1778 domain-containing protein [Rhodospirillum centenum]ACJ00356.1 conserved hypothetical protein [Rhodospirillum centenum SW]
MSAVTDLGRLPDTLAAAADERRSDRMEQRVRPSVKRTIEAAALLAGQDTSDFVTKAAFDRALAELETRFSTRLPIQQFEALAAALDTPPSPSSALRDLMDVYERVVDEPIC